jgi:hypothetical protein
MSTVTGISSSASFDYATQLAQTSALKRSLNSLGNAVQNGDLASAGSVLTALVKANPQYAATASDSSQPQNPINQDFQALADAISNSQADTAQSAWTQIKSDLADNGVTDLSDGTSATAKLLTDTQDSISQQILSDVVATSILGGGSDPSSGAGLASSLLSNWLTYQANGNVSSPGGTSPGGGLFVSALFGGGSDSSAQAGLSSSLISDWLTYRAGGSTSPTAAADSTGTNLNTAA